MRLSVSMEPSKPKAGEEKMKIVGKWFPDPSSYSSQRLFCLDLLRGLDMFYLAALAPFLNWNLFRFHLPDCTAPEWLRLLLMHNPSAFAPTATGVSLYDFGQPFFLFVCGAAVPIALPKRLGPDGRPTAAYWKHLFYRLALLTFFACLNRGLLKFDIGYFYPQADTLLVIAVGYLAAALSLLIRSAPVRWALPFALAAIHWAIQQFGGDYTWDGNVNYAIEKVVFGGLGNKFAGIDGSRHFAFALTTLGFASVALFGARTMEVLLSAHAPWKKVRLLAGLGFGLWAAGAIATIWIPAVRYIYTLSFVFETAGWSMLCLTALYVLTDIWKLRRGTGLLLLFGSSSLFIWETANFAYPAVQALGVRLGEGLPNLFGTGIHPMVFTGFCEMLVVTGMAVMRYQMKSK